MRRRTTPLIATAALALVANVLWAASIETKRISFAPGTSSATVKGSIRGDRIVDYKLGARAGQTMRVTLKTNNGANYFNVLPPGSNDVAVFVGSSGGNEWTGTLDTEGDYTIRIYLMRSAARRNERADYTLTASITGHGHASDVKVPRTPYHATGEVPCVMGSGQPKGSCRFGVIRTGPGSGTVTVTKPDGRTRSISFQKGRATGYDMSQADPGDFSARKRGDTNLIGIGQERYEIPDAVIFRG